MTDSANAVDSAGVADLHVRALEVRAIREELREADFICSTDTIDHYGEVIDQSTWDLSVYLRNSVILYAHDSRELPIGKAKNVAVIDGALQATVVFSKAHQKAEDVWRCVQDGTLRGISVGFLPSGAHAEVRGGRDVIVLTRPRLIEMSITPIPANPDCLAKLRARAFSARATNPKTTPAESAAQEKQIMDEKQIQALKDEHTKAIETERANATKALGAATTELATAKAAHDVASKALRSALTGQTEEKDADPVAAVAKCIERLAADSKAKADALTERDVDDLVGKKITEAQKPEFLELAKSSRKSFDAITKSLPDLGLLKSIVGTETKSGAALPLGASASDELANLADAAE